MQNLQAILCLVIFVVPALFLEGCGGGGSTTKAPGGPTTTKAGDSTTTNAPGDVTTTEQVTTTMKDSTTKTITVPAYTKLQVSSGIVAQVSMGEASNFQVTLDKSMVDDLKTEVKDGLLHVWLDKIPADKPKPIAQIKVKASLDGVTADGGAELTVLNKVTTSVGCSGQGSKVTVHEMQNPANPITIDADTGAVTVTGGTASSVQIHANNGAQVNLGTLEVQKANVVLKAKSILSGMVSQNMQLSLDGASQATTEVDMQLVGTCAGGSKAKITPEGLAVRKDFKDCTSSLRVAV